MAFSSSPSLFLHLIILSLTFSAVLSSDKEFKPPALLLSVRKDEKTNQYYAIVDFGSPQHYVYLVIDLGSDFLWFDCHGVRYNSSTYRRVTCGSPKCKALRPTACYDKKCGVFPYNPMKRLRLPGYLGEDTMSLSWTDGGVAVGDVEASRFPFACAHHANQIRLGGLSKDTQGIVGFSRTQTAFPRQIFSAFNVRQKFTLCLKSSDQELLGSIFIGKGPYFILNFGKELSTLVTKTPLLSNPHDRHQYYIEVKSVAVDGKTVAFNTALLSIDRKTGNGGTKLSTIDPYMVLHSDIYTAVVDEFVKRAESRKMTRVKPVAPFGACFSSKSIGTKLTGPDVPSVDLVLEGKKKAYWRIYGANSMVKVNKNVMCLGFVDGGSKARTSIVIGGHQMEDNFLLFDLGSGTLGFTSSLLRHNTTCSSERLF